MKNTPRFFKVIRTIAISFFILTFLTIFSSSFLDPDLIFPIIFPLFFLTFISFIVMFISTLFLTGKETFKNLGEFTPRFTSQFTTLALQAGYTVTNIAKDDRSGAQYLLDHSTGKILVKVLSFKEFYSVNIVQTLSASLSSFQAEEGWIVSLQKPFLDDQQSYARFYNIQLYTMNEAIIVLGTKR
jgi:hypothetical protein